MKLKNYSLFCAAAMIIAVPVLANAASFEITNGQTVTSAKTLGAGETGLIDQGGTLAVNSGATNSITSSGAGITITNNGTLTAGAANSLGISNSGTGAVITNNGDLTTNGVNGEAISTTGTNSILVNNGNITTHGNFAEGMLADTGSDGTSLTNNSFITTTGTATGMFTISSGSSETNNGTITTGSSSDAYGMLNDGTGNMITNNGIIHTSGTNGMGIFNNGVNATANNYGSITTTGFAGIGMRNGATGGNLNNYGSITTFNSDTDGMASSGANSALTNRGSIVTNNSISVGMHSHAINSTLDNYGSIVSNGPAMRTDSTNNILTNYGSIATSGTNSEGLIAANNNNTLINNGIINVTSFESDGLGSDSGTVSNTFINNGVINASGSNTSGIANYSNNSTIMQNGVINTGGSTTDAIYSGNASNTTLILGANSKSNGSIEFGAGTNLLKYDVSGAGRGGSVATVAGEITGTHTTSIINAGSLSKDAKIIQSGNNVAVVTPDSFAGNDQVVTQAITHSSNIITQRQQAVILGQNAGIPSGTQYAANTSSLSDAEPAAGWGVKQMNVGWVEGFGSYQERPENGSADFSRAKAGGVLAGLDLPQTSDGYMSGFYVGDFFGSIDIGKPKFRDIDSDGILTGGYIGKDLGEFYVSGQLAAGYSRNDSDRSIGGSTANADYNSYFASPSVTVMRPYKSEDITWVPSATLRYTYQYDNSYHEDGSAANQNVDGHSYNSLSGRLQLEAQLKQQHVVGGLLKPSLRAGVEGSTYIGDRSVDLTVLGTNTSFDPQGDDNYVDGILGTNISYTVSDSTELYVDGEASLGLNKGGPKDNIGGTGRVGAKFKF